MYNAIPLYNIHLEMIYTIRDAVESDYRFLFELKKAAEFEAVKAVFGWGEELQLQLHSAEWAEARPEIIQIESVSVGSYLFTRRKDHYYFGRYFLLPQYQGKGLGSEILRQCLYEADADKLPVRLCYLQGNRVGELYKRNGFSVINEDQHFVYMERKPVT